MSDEPLELEAIEELEAAPEPDLSLLDVPCVAQWQRSYRNSRFPCAVVDTSMAVVWSNREFQTLFRREDSFHGHLLSLFGLTAGRQAYDELHRDTESAEIGYSWAGRVIATRREAPTILANLMVSPLIPPPPDDLKGPIGFVAVIDDVTAENKDLLRGTFRSLLEASLLKDNDTGTHVARVNAYSRALALRLFETGDHPEIDREFIEAIGFVAAMHDVGKIGTPDDILNKDGPLDEWEWDVMREHTINGAYILSTHPEEMAKHIALFHHEWFDGSGYPYKISDMMIPLPARIVALADVYDALRMRRSYKEALSHRQACEEIERGLGTHFDSEIGSVFLEIDVEMAQIYSGLTED